MSYPPFLQSGAVPEALSSRSGLNETGTIILPALEPRQFQAEISLLSHPRILRGLFLHQPPPWVGVVHLRQVGFFM